MVNICYAGDEGYAMQIATSMVSVLENSKDTDIRFFVLGDKYPEKIRRRFREIENQYNSDVELIDITEKMHLLDDTALYVKPDIGKNDLISFMFARLFIDSALPSDVEKILYIDGDTIILENVQELYDIELADGCIVGAIRDIWPVVYNFVIGQVIREPYFISGLLLINRTCWHEENIEEKMLKHMHAVKKKYFMHDQDVINVCLKGRIDTLPLKWGMTYILRAYSPEQVLWFCGKTEESFYTRKQIAEAQSHVALIHYAGDYYGRPWFFPQACNDSRIWYKYYKMTTWADDDLNYIKSTKQKVIYVLKRILEKPFKSCWLKKTKKRFEGLSYDELEAKEIIN